ncbi:CPBP family intramembrane glutamic endopeptidase [Bacillus sp. 03113]|uniref:CPBP family intramembrane glutamic endopeptidase n=1 Tax=Bacillus sp. 03113 TaxID=2578211 RepID=UPI001143A0C5|nr:type II CAAX endopeptidase family protein [Bacillus sp. 03113]
MKKEKYRRLVNSLSRRQILFHLYASQILLLMISFILGMILFDRFSNFLHLFQWKDKNILLVGMSAGIIIVAIDLIFMKIVPKHYFDDGGLNEKIFENRHPLHIALIALLVSISEEILFRGVLQTHFGLVIASFIFAIIHYRYLFNWFLLINVIVLSFILGAFYYITGNLLVTMTTHFIIDFLLGIVITLKLKKQKDRMDVP